MTSVMSTIKILLSASHGAWSPTKNLALQILWSVCFSFPCSHLAEEKEGDAEFGLEIHMDLKECMSPDETLQTISSLTLTCKYAHLKPSSARG